MITRRFTLAIAALAFAAAPAAAQDQWNWNGNVAAGRTIEIKGVNGSINAIAARGNEVRVTAVKTARRSETSDVRIEVIEHSGGVTICAVYPSRRGRENECAPGEGGTMNVQNNDVTVAFTVHVPRGVKLDANTVNGSIEITNIAADVNAHTVNGNVTVTSGGLVTAQTVNGNIDVAMGRADWAGALKFETVNGSVSIAFQGDLNARVRAGTVNGSIETDFPLTVQGRFGPKSVNGTVGNGGRELEINTVNGSISLLRR